MEGVIDSFIGWMKSRLRSGLLLLSLQCGLGGFITGYFLASYFEESLGDKSQEVTREFVLIDALLGGHLLWASIVAVASCTGGWVLAGDGWLCM